ncbi:hypothetical protein NOC27_2369 [Nitrosococcus oceani AFC27]|nr:hypothetical protein [Nitrosococcus oceani]EDZ65689.1 hypothetical protein NOC27_2369 [Nitrosococcus oceani AFC27]
MNYQDLTFGLPGLTFELPKLEPWVLKDWLLGFQALTVKLLRPEFLDT